jgi:protein ImuB
MFAVIFIPDFSLQAVLRHEPKLWWSPVGLIDERETKASIFQLTAAARDVGVCEGLTSTQALARCSDIIIKSRSPAQEQTATEALLQTAYNFSPRIESTADGICTIDLQGLPVLAIYASNPKGIASQSAGLRGTSYPGKTQLNSYNPKGVASDESPAVAIPLGLDDLSRLSQGSRSCGNPGLRDGIPLGFTTAHAHGESQQYDTPPAHPSPGGEGRSEGEHPHAKHQTPLQHWAEKILIALSQVNLRAQIGIAATPNLALHAARCAKPVFIVENSTAFISALSIQSLEPSPHIADILERWGIRTVGSFTALGKDKIAERLGPDGVELFDRAAADDTRPLNLITPAEMFAETMEFEVEVESLQPLLFILNRFIEQLASRLTVAGFVAEELRLQLRLASGDKYEHLFAVPSPTANQTVLFRMLQTHLENVRTDSAIAELELSAKPTRSENYQFGLFETALRDPNQFSETLARLAALCGNDNVGTPILQDTHRADAFKMERPRFDASPALDSRPSALDSCGLRLRRFRPAFHADVELENGEPAFISSLKLNSPIQNLSGPFRSSGDWWEQEKLWDRDEWDIQTRDGSVYRIYREKNDWFVEGVYD